MRASSRPQTIQIFLPHGDPSGIRMAEITTRTVRVFDAHRSLLGGFLSTPEASQVGLYFLFGGDSEERVSCYIGQTGNVGGKLKQHVTGKDFWERAIVAVSLTNTWTDTHVGFMEWEAISRAAQAARFPLMNGNAASNRYTPAPLEADCNEYLETISVPEAG
ncbi:GIY-YIG nuclease family protein [Arthrobacter sp. H35-D1]|uniref:GIY-YIG nuclease family protein n=1 Tax=Arthrobacter sp. H35-D1 TaxID=3046202 RepID=UPI0024B8D516|nr:GIY-YIG nuclease family protein [Arthrobacter sp. H35-D1]MDJ0313896.1 GIY-YIG nuclease family protein [Arthrobacter sp. H35-D1]